MNPESIKQIVETIKTLNINFNDATTQKIAEAIMPAVKMYLVFNILNTLLVGLFVSTVILYIARLWWKAFMLDSGYVPKNWKKDN